MAYSNFLPNVWAETIQRELERGHVFVDGTNRQYEGTVSKQGESVTILGVGKPTIRTLARGSASGSITAAEEVADTSVILPINQVRYYNYKVGDIDKAQGVNGIMAALSAEAAEGLANEEDIYVAELVKGATKAFTADQKIIAGTTTSNDMNVLEAIDKALQKLYENDVATNADVEMIVSPRFYTLFKQAYIGKATDNVEELKNGKIARYGNVIVKMSNNVYKTSSNAVDNIQVRTKRAIAFVEPLIHVEAYRPDDGFADAVKGFVLFDGKVVRPKEIINLNVKYS